MFNLFKRNNKKNQILINWNVGSILGFEQIQNTDSVQYVNEDASKMIYFSVLTVSGGDFFSIDSESGGPTIIEDANEWQLKGIKKSKTQILVCVISVKKKDDIEWAKYFFDSIKANPVD